jgi:hypothetical protein
MVWMDERTPVPPEIRDACLRAGFTQPAIRNDLRKFLNGAHAEGDNLYDGCRRTLPTPDRPRPGCGTWEPMRHKGLRLYVSALILVTV